MSNVKVVKLVNGDEIVCDLITGQGDDAVHFNSSTVIAKNPARFVVTQQGVGMMPFSPFSSSTQFTLKSEHILCIGEVEEEIFNAWSSQFGSGIVLAGGDVRAAVKTLKISPNT